MTAFLIVCGIVVVWLARAILVPHVNCWACGGSGKNPFSSSRRFGNCWVCRGKGKRFSLSGRVVHQIWLAWRNRNG